MKTNLINLLDILTNDRYSKFVPNDRYKGLTQRVSRCPLLAFSVLDEEFIDSQTQKVIDFAELSGQDLQNLQARIHKTVVAQILYAFNCLPLVK